MKIHTTARRWAVVLAAFSAISNSVQAQPETIGVTKPPARMSIPLRGNQPAPVKMANQAAMPSFEPTWPQRFELLAGEHESRGFAVTQPGAVRVEVQASGAPLVVSVRRPDGRMIERQGSGQIIIDDTASAADIAKGVLWSVGLRSAQGMPQAPQGAVTARMVPRPVAGGTLSVQHPPADAAAVDAALKQANTQAQQKAASLPPQAAAAPVDLQAQAKQTQAAHDKQVAQRHAVALERLRTAMPAEAHAQFSQRIALRMQGQTLQQAGTAMPVRLIKANAPATLAMPGAQRQAVTPGMLATKGGTSTSQAAATGGAAPVGSSSGAAVATPSAPPVLGSLSTGEGDPGTPVTVNGSEFGNNPGEVHFIVGNGRDIVAPVTYWSAGQVVTEVPYADGIPLYDGHVYVKRSDGAKTALRPFRFVPLYDVTTIRLPIHMPAQYNTTGVAVDSRLGGSALGISRSVLEWGAAQRVYTTSGIIFGDKADDEFYLTSRLKNGWLVVSAVITDHMGNAGLRLDDQSREHAWASIVDVRPGTDSPYLKVHWWIDGGYRTLVYSARITVQRPKNLPCSANPCPVL